MIILLNVNHEVLLAIVEASVIICGVFFTLPKTTSGKTTTYLLGMVN